MALVEQTPRLFDRSVAENIAYGNNAQDMNIREIVRAAKAADIHTFITSLPEVSLSRHQINAMCLKKCIQC